MRRHTIRRLTICLIFSLLLLSGCDIIQREIYPNPTPQNTGTRPNLPGEIGQIRTNAENIMDDLHDKDWSKAKVKVNSLKTLTNSVKPKLQSAKVPANLIEGLTKAVAALEQSVMQVRDYEARVNANQILRYLPDIADSFAVGKSTDLERIDFYAREVRLNIEKKNWAMAKNNAVRLQSIWHGLRPQLANKSSNNSASFDAHINNLVKSIEKQDAKQAENNVLKVMDYLDLIESDFAKQDKDKKKK